MIEAEHLDSETDYKVCADMRAKMLSNFDLASGDERYSGFQATTDDNLDRRYHAVVNYLTAVLIRVILQTFRGDYWVNNLVAMVARLAAKVKILGNDLPRAVEQTLQKSADARIRINQEAARDKRYVLTGRKSEVARMGTRSCARTPGRAKRDGGIGAASEVGVTRPFTAGFQVCLQTWETLRKETVNSKNTNWTSIQWK